MTWSPIKCGRKLSNLWPTVMGTLKALYIYWTHCIYCTSVSQDLSSPVRPHYRAVLLSNTAKCSVLPQLFHEIQPYGFDINGKYDCGPSALSHPSPCLTSSSSASSEICMTMVSLFFSQVHSRPTTFPAGDPLTPRLSRWQSSQDVSSQQNLRCLSAEARPENAFFLLFHSMW